MKTQWFASWTIVFVFSATITFGAAGPVALWRGDGDANDSAGSINGTLVNGTSFGPGIAPGQAGQAFSFDGNDDEVRFPNSPVLNFTTAFSVSGWLRTTGTAPFSGLIDRFNQAGETSGFQISMSGDNGFPPNRSGILRGDLGIGSTYVTAFNLQKVDDGVPHHFALVWNGEQAVLYVDGVAGDAIPLTNWTNNTAEIVLGTDTDAGGRHFKGQLDEIGLYDRALSLAEVQSLAGLARLDIALIDSGHVQISWPSTAEGFRLQGNSSFDPVNWFDVLSDGTNRVSVPIDGSARFYRLVKP